MATKDLTAGALHLVYTRDEVPETALCLNRIGGEQTHPENLGVRLRGSRQVTPNNLVLKKLKKGVKQAQRGLRSAARKQTIDFREDRVKVKRIARSNQRNNRNHGNGAD